MSSVRRIRLLGHAPMARPWTPFAAHVLSAVVTCATSIALGVALALAEHVAIRVGGHDPSIGLPHWIDALGEVALHLLFMWVGFLYHLVLFYPAFLVALRRGLGGAASAAALSASIFSGFTAITNDPFWQGLAMGVVYGGLYGLAFHPLAAWCARRPRGGGT